MEICEALTVEKGEFTEIIFLEGVDVVGDFFHYLHVTVILGVGGHRRWWCKWCDSGFCLVGVVGGSLEEEW